MIRSSEKPADNNKQKSLFFFSLIVRFQVALIFSNHMINFGFKLFYC